MKTHDVFGIVPEIRSQSYVDRGDLDKTLETYLARSLHVAMKGPSKCGKSWLRQKSLSNALIVQCRHNKPYTDIYVNALSLLNIRLEIQRTESDTVKGSLIATSEVGAALIAKVSGTVELVAEKGDTTQTQCVGHDVSDLKFIADIIKQSGRRLVIEDFHYMKIEDRKAFAFDLKTLWDYGLFVVIVGVWSGSNLLLSLNPDLTGRVHEISITWANNDLREIIIKGSSELNIEVTDSVIARLVSLAYSNAGILQQLTLLSLDDAGIVEGISGLLVNRQQLNDIKHVEAAAMLYVDQLNAVYQQFAKRVSAGIRTRQRATGIYAHTLAVIMEASDDELIQGLCARTICDRAQVRQSRIQYSNLKAILSKIESLQLDDRGCGVIISYNEATEEVAIVDRQLLLYRKYSTIKWPWEDIITEAEAKGGEIEAD